MTGKAVTVVREYWWVRFKGIDRPEVARIDFENGRASRVWFAGMENAFEPDQVEFLALVRLPKEQRGPSEA
jgi:hypothetical protein